MRQTNPRARGEAHFVRILPSPLGFSFALSFPDLLLSYHSPFYSVRAVREGEIRKEGRGGKTLGEGGE